MKSWFLVVAVATAFKATPVTKVIDLLKNMVEKGKEDKVAEETRYEAFRKFCLKTIDDTTHAITTSDERIEFLTAENEKLAADAARQQAEVAVHDDDISVWHGDKKAARKVRNLEETDFAAKDKDYAESLDALERAIAVMKQNQSNTDENYATAALLQAQLLIPKEQRNLIDAFLQNPAETRGSAQYEFQSKGIVDLLQQLHDKFRSEHKNLQQTEEVNRNEFERLMLDMDNKIKEATRQRTEKNASANQKLETKGKNEGEIKDLTVTRNDDQKFLDDTKANCQQKADDFASRNQLRADEIKALEAAINILKNGAVDTAEAHTFRNTAFLQLRSSTVGDNDRDRVVAYLEGRAAHLHSRSLSALVLKMSEDPFTKVKQMIQDLVARLQAEAGDEAKAKAVCDKQLDENEARRSEKTTQTVQLNAEKEELEADIAKLAEQLATLDAEIKELGEQMATAQTNRANEKEKNATVVKDAKAAQEAVEQATRVLQDFYAKAGQATAFVEQRPVAPETFDRPYQGMQAESGGVIGVLEVIKSDYARLEAETKAEEEQSAAEHKQFMADARASQAQKKKDVEHKTLRKQDQEQALGEKKTDLEATQESLGGYLKEYGDIRATCLDTGLSYEDRVEQRKAEIESLRQALKILRGEGDEE